MFVNPVYTVSSSERTMQATNQEKCSKTSMQVAKLYRGETTTFWQRVCSKGKTQGSASGELLCLLHEELIVFSKLR
ncbi:hypothetical protein QYF36_026326 [Acer negundo]|nr:hypothetical protein QYF36_026326 [Acer negundo]